MNNLKDKIVLLDLGRVVFEFYPELTFKALKLPSVLGGFDNIYKKVSTSKTYLDFELGKLEFSKLQTALLKEINIELSDEEFLAAWNACLPKPLEGIDQVLQKFSKDTQYYALSNTNKIHLKHMKSFPVMKYFTEIFASSELGLRKPDPEIFKCVLKRLSISDPSKVLFVDDLIENINAAKSLGIKAEQSINSTTDLNKIVSSFLYKE